MKPDFRMKFLGANIFRAGDDRHTGIGVEARIWNLGEPVAIPQWTLTIKLKDEKPTTIHSTPTPVIGVWVTGKPPVNFHHADDLSVKTATAEVGKTPIQGHILFYTSVEQANVTRPTTVLTVEAEDIYGGVVKVSQTLGRWGPGVLERNLKNDR